MPETIQNEACPSCKKCFQFNQSGQLEHIISIADEGSKIAEGFEHFVIENRQIPPACKIRYGRCLARECLLFSQSGLDKGDTSRDNRTHD